MVDYKFHVGSIRDNLLYFSNSYYESSASPSIDIFFEDKMAYDAVKTHISKQIEFYFKN
ncbi:hypothetical protein TPENAI_60745 [Tenacibaculum litopenaei]